MREQPISKVEDHNGYLGCIDGLSSTFSAEFTLELFRRASFIRQFEFKVKEAFDNKLIQIPIYLSLGQEFIAAALSMVLDDYNIFAQHRSHGIYLSFGAKPEALRDELLGLESGCAGGMSGSNAIHAPEINMFGHSGLMGEQVPIAVGAALASNNNVLTVCGDASVEEDYIYPSLGFAGTRKLPILFVCEDNGLSILTPVETRRNWSVVNVAHSVGIPAIDITDDPWLIAHHVGNLSKDLPAFINIRTERHLWHSGTGTDGEPKWNRYELVKAELAKLGLAEHIKTIEIETKNQAEEIWKEQQQKQ